MIEIFEHGNSGISVFSYKGLKALQVVGVENAFTTLYENIKDDLPDIIIELGSDYGGLTNLLADHNISKNAAIHTYDINESRFVSHNDKITFHGGDMWVQTISIHELIQNSNRALVLCDGGDKRREFAVFQASLRSDDIIMAHDYSATTDSFKSECFGKIWNWHEFEDSFANFTGLDPFLQEEFAKYAWCIRKKK